MGVLVDAGKKIAAQSGGEPRIFRTIDFLESSHQGRNQGRTDEFAEHMVYREEDDSRDIDWKASARTGVMLIKKFQPHSERSLVLVADVGKGMAAMSPCGVDKHTVLVQSLSVLSLIGIFNKVSLGLVYGDRGMIMHRSLSKGEDYAENLLESVNNINPLTQGASNPEELLHYAYHHFTQRAIVVMVTQTPLITSRLEQKLAVLRARHKVVWFIIDDAALVSDRADLPHGYDVDSGAFIQRGELINAKVVQQYQAYEEQERERLKDFFRRYKVPHGRLSSAHDVVRQLRMMNQERYGL